MILLCKILGLFDAFVGKLLKRCFLLGTVLYLLGQLALGLAPVVSFAELVLNSLLTVCAKQHAPYD